MSILINFYITLIAAHRKSINDVLALYKPAVMARLKCNRSGRLRQSIT